MIFLFIGDIIGKPGRSAVKALLPKLKAERSPDLVIANGENAAGGMGITPGVAEELFAAGVNVITTGNHVWKKKEIIDYLTRQPKVIRPANFPPGTPGRGEWTGEVAKGKRVLLINLQGRIFMESLDCPFRKADELLSRSGKNGFVVVDFHAEATSEKAAIAMHLNGRVSAVIGTHTHVQTADERILSGGTAFITDAGMTGPSDSVIGVKKEIALRRFVTQLPVKFEVASSKVMLQGVFVTIDDESGKATRIERISIPWEGSG